MRNLGGIARVMLSSTLGENDTRVVMSQSKRLYGTQINLLTPSKMQSNAWTKAEEKLLMSKPNLSHSELSKLMKTRTAEAIRKKRLRNVKSRAVGSNDVELELESAKEKLKIHNLVQKNYKKISIKEDRGGNDRTCFLDMGDWHIEERVRPETIHGINEYSVKIAEERMKRFFSNGVKLVRNVKHCNELVLVLGGDFISGYIHEELVQGNNLSPTKAIHTCYSFLRSGIEYIRQNLDHKLTIVCVVGNHARTGQKRTVETAVENSYEWLMYKMLESHFDGVDFIIPEGKMCYLDIYGKTIRITHGDQIRGGRGIGGVTVPILRKIAQWDNSKKADLTILHHFHQLIFFTNFVCNGSGVGFNAFAEEIGASPEPPQQAFFVFEKDRGVTLSAPVFLDNY